MIFTAQTHFTLPPSPWMLHDAPDDFYRLCAMMNIDADALAASHRKHWPQLWAATPASNAGIGAQFSLGAAQ